MLSLFGVWSFVSGDIYWVVLFKVWEVVTKSDVPPYTPLHRLWVELSL